MTIDPARFQKLLDEFRLEALFNELGWDRAGARPWEVATNSESFTVRAIAQKRGVAVFLGSPDRDGHIPSRATLLKIEKEAAKLAHEHLLIFADAAKTALTWLWVSRAPGQPTATRTHTWHRGQSGEALRQKLEAIVWSLEAEEAITLTDVVTGLRRAFDRDRVTRAFYDRFQTEHQGFSAFIQGLAGATDREWYASLMLNRLMFVYFIQCKGFLDGNANYLADRLREVQAKAGRDRFHSFYRLFLRRLFHEGLGTPKADRAPDLSGLIGDVPYLNGGLFDVHQLEEAHPDIDITDAAFERLFRFFDGYDWHLDDRPLKAGNEINPDVLGYIFEKYINQKQMGAYYTREDITEYIAKNTVLPHLLERARERCKVAFEGEASVWSLLRENPDRYLYPAMKIGVIDAAGVIVPESALPDFVQTGMKDAKARMFDRRYNLGEAVFATATGERGTLPTETWREYVERRTRCLAIRERLADGEVKSADDLVTLNLDIRQFVQDVIDTCASPDLLRAIWQAIVGRVPEKSNERFRHGITILDPTCGSGAFLFAALNILEPLYEGCLDRMEGFVEDAKRFPPSPSGRGAGGEGATRRHHDIPAETLRFARKLRQQQTDAESLVWMLLRDRRLGGYKFRRQYPVTPYILDFYCHEARLAIEVDGGQHADSRRYDSTRDAFLTAQGIQVLRFWNNQVFAETEAVLEAIWQALQIRAPSPPIPLPEGEGRLPKRAFADFDAVLAEVEKHPSRRYFIYKSIILHNLFGVDLMAEAVEICKLRLFLKLVSQVDSARHLEPLPDIDFNIHCGNTLVGYATEAQFDAANNLASDQDHRREIKARTADLADLFDRFREQQTRLGGQIAAEDKRGLREKLNALGLELDRYLARDYGIDPDAISPLLSGEGSGVRAAFEKWRESHQPFHWFAEFYGVMREGGFDVVIGNPPYVVNSARTVSYDLSQSGLATLSAGNLYAFVFERSTQVTKRAVPISLIVQLTAVSSGKMRSLQDLLLARGSLMVLPYPRRPESMFDGVEMPVVILSSYPTQGHKIVTTRIGRMYGNERSVCLEKHGMVTHEIRLHGHRIGKLYSETEKSIIAKIVASRSSTQHLVARCGDQMVYYQEACRYWLKAQAGLPFFSRNNKVIQPPHGRIFPTTTASAAAFLGCLLNSSLFYWYYSLFSDCEHVNDDLVKTVPIPDHWAMGCWQDLSEKLSYALTSNAKRKVIRTRQGHFIEYDEMKASRAKAEIDDIDIALGKIYSLTDEETDFIINYDIKYRMGGAEEDE